MDAMLDKVNSCRDEPPDSSQLRSWDIVFSELIRSSLCCVSSTHPSITLLYRQTESRNCERAFLFERVRQQYLSFHDAWQEREDRAALERLQLENKVRNLQERLSLQGTAAEQEMQVSIYPGVTPPCNAVFLGGHGGESLGP